MVDCYFSYLFITQFPRFITMMDNDKKITGTSVLYHIAHWFLRVALFLCRQWY
jgi:hypothetical protein